MLLPDASKALEEKQLLQRSTQTILLFISLTGTQQSTHITKSIPFPFHIYKKMRMYLSSLSQETRVSSKYHKITITWIVKPNPYIY